MWVLVSEHDLGDCGMPYTTIHGVFSTPEQAKKHIIPGMLRGWQQDGENWYMQVGMTLWTVRRFVPDKLTNTQDYPDQLVTGGG